MLRLSLLWIIIFGYILYAFVYFSLYPSDFQTQSQEEAITEDDLRLIQERETAIRALEVQEPDSLC